MEMDSVNFYYFVGCTLADSLTAKSCSVRSWTPYSSPKSMIYNPKLNDKPPWFFHMWIPPLGKPVFMSMCTNTLFCLLTKLLFIFLHLCTGGQSRSWFCSVFTWLLQCLQSCCNSGCAPNIFFQSWQLVWLSHKRHGWAFCTSTFVLTAVTFVVL